LTRVRLLLDEPPDEGLVCCWVSGMLKASGRRSWS
jgi:hypothetical protein